MFSRKFDFIGILLTGGFYILIVYCGKWSFYLSMAIIIIQLAYSYFIVIIVLWYDWLWTNIIGQGHTSINLFLSQPTAPWKQYKSFCFLNTIFIVRINLFNKVFLIILVLVNLIHHMRVLFVWVVFCLRCPNCVVSGMF